MAEQKAISMETVAGAKELAMLYYKANIPCYTEGKPGVGKSELWRQLATALGIGFIDVRLAQMDPVDLRGLPKNDGEFTTWNRPDFWPLVKRDGPKGIILFDELGDCGRAMQSAAYQVILDRRAGPHELPKGWYPSAAGNSQAHKSGAQVISKALANRFAWIYVEPDIHCFLDHAATMGYHQYVIAFLKHRVDFLHKMDSGDDKAFPSPRSWEFVSRLCDGPTNSLYRAVRGCIGDGPAGEFCAFVRSMDIPDFEDIIKSPKKCKIPEQPSHRFCVSSMLSRFATTDNIAAIYTYIKRDEFGREFEVCTMLDAVKRDKIISDTTTFVEFANRNADLQL